MLKRKVPAVVAVLLMSSISAQAFESADRPGPISEAFISPSAAITGAMSDDDRLRRQLNNQVVLLSLIAALAKPTEPPRPTAYLQTRVAQVVGKEGPGRLSAEFSTIEKVAGIRFEYGPGLANSWLKPIGRPAVAMQFEDRPGSVSNRFKTRPAVSMESAGRRDFTSSVPRVAPPYGLHLRQRSMEFCVGSIAPCGQINFVELTEQRDS